jgi:hypothetical protein
MIIVSCISHHNYQKELLPLNIFNIRDVGSRNEVAESRGDLMTKTFFNKFS